MKDIVYYTTVKIKSDWSDQQNVERAVKNVFDAGGFPYYNYEVVGISYFKQSEQYEIWLRRMIDTQPYFKHWRRQPVGTEVISWIFLLAGKRTVPYFGAYDDAARYAVITARTDNMYPIQLLA